MLMRFTVIDGALLHDHFHLAKTDECYFIREYRTTDRFVAGESLSLLKNLKKKPTEIGFRYKSSAIEKCAAEFSAVIESEALNDWTFVPIPPSKINSHPEYDDRMVQVCKNIHAEKSPDVREIVKQRVSTRAAHESAGNRLTHDELLGNYYIDEKLTHPEPENIAIVDDTITAGTHFKAMQAILSHRFPNARIIGLIWVRRAIDNNAAISEFKDES